jgi:hypothetical protein
LAFPISQVDAETSRIEAAFSIAEDGLDVYREWRVLVLLHNVSGVQVHDCYLAAGITVRKIDRLLTFNGSDFVRYGIRVVSPDDMFPL